MYRSISELLLSDARPLVGENVLTSAETPSREPKRSAFSAGSTEELDLNIGVRRKATAAEITPLARTHQRRNFHQTTRVSASRVKPELSELTFCGGD